MTPPPSSAGSDVIIRRGLVNINTRNTNVLASAFLNMPLRDWDPTYATDGLGLGTLNANQAYVAAQNLQNFMQSNLPNGLATNTDALTMTPWNSATMMSSMSLTNEMDRKAFVRNAMSLFTARQQIYTIIVRADAMSYEYGGVVQGSGNSNNPLNNGTVLGSAQAVFQIWRDPVRDANGNHPCFVRLCKIMSL